MQGNGGLGLRELGIDGPRAREYEAPFLRRQVRGRGLDGTQANR
jgi:hypothetical protein